MFEESDYEIKVSLLKFPLSAQWICIFSQFPISVTHVYRSVYKWNDMIPKICFQIHPQKVGARDERQLDTWSSLFKVGNGYRMIQSLYDSLYFYLPLKLSIIKSLKISPFMLYNICSTINNINLQFFKQHAYYKKFKQKFKIWKKKKRFKIWCKHTHSKPFPHDIGHCRQLCMKSSDLQTPAQKHTYKLHMQTWIHPGPTSCALWLVKYPKNL